MIFKEKAIVIHTYYLYSLIYMPRNDRCKERRINNPNHKEFANIAIPFLRNQYKIIKKQKSDVKILLQDCAWLWETFF